jgi:rubrerythrin
VVDKFSRRDFINLSVSLSLAFPLSAYAMKGDNDDRKLDYPITILALKQAFIAEMMAHKHYLGYVEKALTEKYSNIAYMFHAFSFSEKIHADNYQRILNELGSETSNILASIYILDTKSNLQKAAEKELEKIVKFYPDLLKTLESESCEKAIINCMYSWKSHRQHEEKVTEIQKYSGIFFGSVLSHIEEKNLDFHVCIICGSTINEAPRLPCEICNRSMAHYKKVNRPT